MRILHTSDWHLGRSFHKVGLVDHQAQVLAHLTEVARDAEVDVVVVAGDVYDRALPSVEAVTVLDDALAALRGTGATVVVSSGNHDSATRLGFGSRLLGAAGVHVRTDPRQVAVPLLLQDAHSPRVGPVAVYPLPFLEPAVAAPALGLPREPTPSHEVVLTAAMDAVRADLAARGGLRSVVSAHAFVTGAAPCDSERALTVGGVAAVSVEAFAGIDYVALGHLHGRQAVAPNARYSGSPLAYSFSEHSHRKGAWLVELGEAGLESVTEVPLPAPRPLALLAGELEHLLTDPGLAVHEAAWCQVTLTDAARPAEAMRRLQARFPHAVDLRFAPASSSGPSSAYPRAVEGRDDLDVCCAFLDHVRGRPAQADDREALRQALEALRRREAEAAGVVDLGRVRPARPAPSAGSAASAPSAPAQRPAVAG
ncbi:MAG: exonuclease SbcCD subunit D [Kineosporiaceae bacterium]